MISVRFTWETTSPETSASGDVQDRGYCDSAGNRITDLSMSDEEIDKTDVEQWSGLGDLYYLLDDAINFGIYEPSDSAISEYTWFSSIWTEVNFSTGEEIRYSLHIDGLNDEQMVRIAAILNKSRISDDDESWLESIESDSIGYP